MNRYLKEYKWSNIAAMIRNSKSEPEAIADTCTGKLVVITGATSGIGYETAKYYASRGADLLCINRNKEKSQELRDEIERNFNVNCSCYVADFTRMTEIHETARMLNELPKDIDILIHNAGVYNTGKRFTPDGIEEVFQVNYLSSFIINYALREKLRMQKAARILYVNSEGHRFAIGGLHLDDLSWNRHHYTGLKSYGSAKTAQLLSLFPFQEAFSGTGVTINAMHPGNVKTNMGENNGPVYRFLKHLLVDSSALDPLQAAKALYYLGVSEKLGGITGKFFSFTTEEIPAPHALDTAMAAKLWALSLELGGLI